MIHPSQQFDQFDQPIFLPSRRGHIAAVTLDLWELGWTSNPPHWHQHGRQRGCARWGPEQCLFLKNKSRFLHNQTTYFYHTGRQLKLNIWVSSAQLFSIGISTNDNYSKNKTLQWFGYWYVKFTTLVILESLIQNRLMKKSIPRSMHCTLIVEFYNSQWTAWNLISVTHAVYNELQRRILC